MKLKIPTVIFQQMVDQAKAQIPIEACGILAGIEGRVEKFYQMTNADNSGTHFTLDPPEQFSVVKDIRAKELEMLAVYHSHPTTPARPSQEDIRFALTPDVVYVILSLAQADEPIVKGFNIKDSGVSEVPVEIIN